MSTLRPAARCDVPKAQLPRVVGAPGEHAAVLRQRDRVLVAELDVGTEGEGAHAIHEGLAISSREPRCPIALAR